MATRKQSSGYGSQTDILSSIKMAFGKLVKAGPFGWSYDDRPVTGAWNGDGETEIGVWRSSDQYFYLDVKGDGKWDTVVKFAPFGKTGDVPIIGDWNADGKDEVGVWEPESRFFYLDNNSDGLWDTDKGDLKLGPFGDDYDTPITGNWGGGKKDLVGVWDPYTKLSHLNINGDGKWEQNHGNVISDLSHIR